MENLKPLKMHTDGSSVPQKPEVGAGWAMCMKMNGRDFILYGHLPAPATNNVAEMYGVIVALRVGRKINQFLTVYTDSQYTEKSLNEWRNKWERSGFPTKNRDLIMRLFEAHDQHKKCCVRWIKGHAGHAGNELADYWSKEGRNKNIVDVDNPDRRVIGFHNMEEVEDFLMKTFGV